MSRGIEPGDKVALSCPNLPYFPIVYYGILKAGAVVVPLNVLLKGREIAYHLGDSDAKAYFCFEGTPDLPMGQTGTPASSRPTAASTSSDHRRPGAASPVEGTETLAHGAARASRRRSSRWSTERDRHRGDPLHQRYDGPAQGRRAHALQPGAQRADLQPAVRHAGHRRTTGTWSRCRCSTPSAPTVQMNAGFSVGATLVLLPRFDAAQAVGAAAEGGHHLLRRRARRCTGACSARSTDDVDVDTIAGNLRIAVSGGAALPVEIIKQFKERFHVQILEGYGLSETSPVATFSDPEQRPAAGLDRRADLGRGGASWSTSDWNIVEGTDEVGEIAIRGHNIMKGYYNRPDATAEVMRNGWFRTGDLARRDEDGFYYIVDRAKDMIIRGGFNVYPREIEEVLMTHPAVSLAAVVGVAAREPRRGDQGVRDPQRGRRRRPRRSSSPGARSRWRATSTRGSSRSPRRLPMTATGKILKRELS